MNRYPTSAVRTASRRVGSHIGVRPPRAALIEACKAARLLITKYAGAATSFGSRRPSGHHHPTAAHKPATAVSVAPQRAHAALRATHASAKRASTATWGTSQRQTLWLARI